MRGRGVGSEASNEELAATEATGAKGIRARDPADVAARVKAALEHRGGPVVLDVVVDPHAIAVPSHIHASAAKGFTLSIAKEVLHGRLDDVIDTATHSVRLL